MAAAVVSNTAVGRVGAALGTLAAIPITIVFTATTYTTATGGAPFDIATLLNNAGPGENSINPSDVVGIMGGAATGYRCDGLTVGTPTYTDTTDTSFNKHLSLATCPVTARLWNGITEIGDGAITQTVTGFLLVFRGGSLKP